MLLITFATLGLIIGSFINALVWRIKEQDSKAYKKLPAKQRTKLSIINGTSMCPHCRHELAPKDLIPVISWLNLRGKCRYCQRPIGWQYPVVELTTSVLFAVSYAFWPLGWDAAGTFNFAAWLVILTGSVALVVYDLRWMLLPNRIVYPLIVIAATLAVFNLAVSGSWNDVLSLALSVVIAGGLFYVIFIVSNGRWIGGGDVKLGYLIGLLVQDPYKAFLVLLTASFIGTLVVLPGLALKKVTPKSRIPFGPFLIAAAVVVFLFGGDVISWYKDSLLLL